METEIINNEAVTDIAESTQHAGGIGLGQSTMIVGGIVLAVGIAKAGLDRWAAYKKRCEVHLVGEEETPVEEAPET